jgi:uncharacterized protein involved in outer membrane biogenesis
MKKVLKYTGIGLFSLLVLAFTLPILFKGKIVSAVKSGINKNIEAKVDFTDVSLSLFRHFPQLSVSLENIAVTGLGEFAKDTLVSAPSIDASVNMMSLFTGRDIKVKGVYFNEPRIHALVNKEGKANWEITKADTSVSTAQPSAFQVQLEKYAIKNGYVYYRDESSDMTAEITGLDHEGKGDLNQDLFKLTTSTNAGMASFSYANIPYLVKAKTDIDADFEIDNRKSRYSFSNAAIMVNDLKLVADGFMQLDNDSTYSMDIKFDAPSNEFKTILSLIPAIYQNDFAKLKTRGTAAFKGFVKGIYSPTQIPAYDVNLEVKDGFFQYPDLPQPVKNVQVSAHISNPDGITDHTVIDIPKAHLEMGAEPFDFRLLVKNPETSRYVDGALKGKINLAELTKFVKLQPGTKLSGTLAADAFAKGNVANLQQGDQSFSAGGFVNISNLYYASRDFVHPVQNGNFTIELENKGGIADGTTINITSGHLEVANDPLDFSLKISRPVTAIDFAGTAKGHITLDNVNQFMTLEPGTTIKGLMDMDLKFSGSKDAVDKKNYEQINTSGTLNVSNVNYTSKEYPAGLQVQKAMLVFSPQHASLENFSGRFMNTKLTASGVLDNMIGYAMNKGELGGTLNLQADRINLNDWMGTDTATSTTSSSAPFLVPGKMNIMVNAAADAVKYDKVTYNNVKGALQVKDETVRLQNVQTQALDGTITFNGSYSTRQHKEKPDVSLDYNIKDVDVQKAFFAYNTMQQLMPVGRFLAGKLSSQFSMTGNLKGDMFPDLASLTGNGNLLLIQGVLSKFQPLEKLANMLNIDALKEVPVKDIKSHFEFANGKVLVKPFTIKVKDIDMEIGGMHGFNQSLDYIIAMKVPRKYLGANGNALVNNLAAQANAKGIPVTLSDIIDLNVKMEGSISNPVIKTDLKQAAGDVTKELKQQATAFIKQKTDSARQTIKDSLTVVKKQVLEDVKGEVTKQLLGNKDSSGKPSVEGTKQKATETLKNTFNGLFKKKKAAADTSGKGD